MLEITESQWSILSQNLDTQFIKKCARRIKVDFPEAFLKYDIHPDNLVTLVRDSLKRAKGYGLQYKADLILFLDCTMTLGPNFDHDSQHPAIFEILQRNDIDGSEKMKLIDEYLYFGMDEPR